MNARSHLPDTNRLSVLTALVLLAYAVTPFIHPPAQDLAMQLPGFFFNLNFEFRNFISLIAAGLAAAGMDWLLSGHPNLRNQPTFPHLILPALTAWAIGLPLATIRVGPAWWALFALGSVLLVIILVAEYIVVDESDSLHAPATMMLTAVSFALFLVMAVALRSSGQRLYLILPVIGLGAGLVAGRSLYLNQSERWFWGWAAGISLVIGQITIGLHYLPVPPLSFGLILLGCLFGLISLANGINEEHASNRVWIEPILVLILFIILSILFAS